MQMDYEDFIRHLKRRGPYDHVVPFGQWCGPALWLRKLGLRGTSLPFDWLLGDDVSLEGYADVVCSRFDTFCTHDALRLTEVSPVPQCEIDANVHYDANDHYLDILTGLQFLHDFPPRGNFEADYPAVQRKFRRRAERLLALMSSGGTLLFVHFIRHGHTKVGTVESVARRLRKMAPKADLLVIDSCEGSIVANEVDRGIFYVSGPFWDKIGDDRYGNKTLCKRLFSSVRVRGRIRNLLRRRIDRLRVKLATMCHLTSAARRNARRKLEH